jgi:hypothetical protein
MRVVVAGIFALRMVGCAAVGPQCDSCHSSAGALFKLSCTPADIVSLVASGPCAPSDASIEQLQEDSFVTLASPSSTGTCHVALTFATGFVYSTDVTFTSQSGGCAGCPATIGPTQGEFMVGNPSDTCSAAPEAGVSGAGDAAAE